MKDPVLKLQLLIELAPFKIVTSGPNLDVLTTPEWDDQRGGVLVKVLNAIDTDRIIWGPHDEQEGFAKKKVMWNVTWLNGVIFTGTIFYVATVERGRDTFEIGSVELNIT